jgi:hypothetical protein
MVVELARAGDRICGSEGWLCPGLFDLQRKPKDSRHKTQRRIRMKKIAAVVVIALFMVGCWIIPSHAADVTGKYTYTEKGYTGVMIIKNTGRFFTFKFQTTSKSNGQMCEFSATEAPSRVNDDQPAHGESESGVKFKISFKGNAAFVNVQDKGSECGMSGYFGGKYVKAGK